MSAKPDKATEKTTGKVTEEQLRACLEGKWKADRVIALLEPHPSSELKHLQKTLTQLRTELRKLERVSWSAADRKGGPLVVAGVLCSDTPAQAASWLASGDLFFWYWHAAGPMYREGLLTNRHDDAWVRDLTLRLAAKLRTESGVERWQFMSNLAIRSGALPAITPAYVNGWLSASHRDRGRQSAQREQPIPLKDWLRRQPRLRECVAGLFTTDGVGAELASPGYVELPPENLWPNVLNDLAAEGLLDRAELLDACADRLLRGDRPGSLAGYIQVFEGLGPTSAEIRERRGLYQSMATSAASPVAKLAQQALRALDTAQPGEPMDLAELTEAILARPEVGLATTQLAWLDAAIKRDRGTVDVLLPSVGAAFAHPATSVQQRALKMVAKHLKAAGPRAVAELRDAALSINPALKADADALFAPYIDDLASDTPLAAYGIPEYQPSPLPPLPATPEELATAFAPCFSNGELTPLEVEQILASVAALTHRDRDGLAEVLRPLAARYREGEQESTIDQWELWEFPYALHCLFDAILGVDRRVDRIRIVERHERVPEAALLLRVQELTDHLLRGETVPLLLATPTEASGAIDPDVFATRLATYRELGIEPLRWDLEQAELRTTPDPVRQKTFADLVLGEPGTADEELGKPDVNRIYLHRAARKQPAPNADLSTVSLASFLYLEPVQAGGELRLPQRPNSWSDPLQSTFGAITLPHDPDAIAAHLLNPLYERANAMGSRTPEPSPLLALAETAGTPGPLTHLALVYGLAADVLDQRIGAQDAVLILASRGLLQPAQLGRLAAIAWQRNLIRGKRIVDALGHIDESGATTEVFDVAAAMIGVLTKTPELRGLPDLLLLASRCAVNAGIRRGTVPGLDELATASKPKRVGVEARRLQEAIAER